METSRSPENLLRDYKSKQVVSLRMSPNKKLVERYFGTTERSRRAPLLAENVEWIEWGDGVPIGGVRHVGKTAYLQNYGDDAPRAEIHRMTEEGNVVVAEGTARVPKKDGTVLTVRFVDIFELENGRIVKKSSFGALLKDSP